MNQGHPLQTRDRSTRASDRMSVLDIYAAMVSRWRPGRDRIREVAPRAIAAAERAEAHPLVGPVFARNFNP
jgi:GST-like protein